MISPKVSIKVASRLRRVVLRASVVGVARDIVGTKERRMTHDDTGRISFGTKLVRVGDNVTADTRAVRTWDTDPHGWQAALESDLHAKKGALCSALLCALCNRALQSAEHLA